MPAKAFKPAPRAKRSKSDVQKEFAEIQEQAEEAREAVDWKAEEAARLREAEVRQSVDGVSVEGVVQKVSGLGLPSRAQAGPGRCRSFTNVLGRL